MMMSTIHVEESTGRTTASSSNSSASSHSEEDRPEEAAATPRRKNTNNKGNKRKGKLVGKSNKPRDDSLEKNPATPLSRPPGGTTRFPFRSQSTGRYNQSHSKNSNSLPKEQRPPLVARPRIMLRRWRSADATNVKSSHTFADTKNGEHSSSTTGTDPMRHTRVFTVFETNDVSTALPDQTVTSVMETPRFSNRTKIIYNQQDCSAADPQQQQEQLWEYELQLPDDCATAILQHSYLELCGELPDSSENDCLPDPAHTRNENQSTQEQNPEDKSSRRRRHMPDDPTVQESIECVFASQLGENLALMLQPDEDDDDVDDDDGGSTTQEMGLLAPSMLQQSLLSNRWDNRALDDCITSKKTQRKRNKKLEESLKLVHVSTYDPNEPKQVPESSGEAEADTMTRASHDSTPCPCSEHVTPIVSPEHWPQRPLLLRPTPNGGTVVKGIRKAGSSEYLWKAQPDSLSTLTWPNALRHGWGKDIADTQNNLMDLMCSRCMILPINNGNEELGESLVTEFESELFEGTLLLRMRATEGTTPKPYNDDIGYFHGMNRRYQAVVRGRFKKSIPLTQCLTGFVLDRPCGKLPAKWVLKGSLKVLSFFAPQLKANFDGPHPSSLTPLGSTPQVLSLHRPDEGRDIEMMQEEPTNHENTIMGEASGATSTLQRARYRKKNFDKLFTQKSPVPMTDTTKVYTFEFLQHLFNFNDFSVELGSMFGSIKLKDVLDGQPLQIMAMCGDQRLWSFDVWHEVLVDDARKHDKQQQARGSSTKK